MFSYYLSQNENPKVIEILDNNWKKLIKNDDFHLIPKSSIYFNWTIPLIQNNDLIETHRTPKGQISPKIYSKWDISFFNLSMFSVCFLIFS